MTKTETTAALYAALLLCCPTQAHDPWALPDVTCIEGLGCFETAHLEYYDPVNKTIFGVPFPGKISHAPPETWTIAAGVYDPDDLSLGSWYVRNGDTQVSDIGIPGFQVTHTSGYNDRFAGHLNGEAVWVDNWEAHVIPHGAEWATVNGISLDGHRVHGWGGRFTSGPNRGEPYGTWAVVMAAPGVPEPATLGLLLVGVGLVGRRAVNRALGREAV